MKTFRERAKELADNCKKVKNNKVYETLSKEFNIGVRTAADRFKSIFGMPVRDYITKNITPSKEKLIDCFIESKNFEEFYKLSGYNDISGLSKLLHNYFGESNYFKIKLKMIAKIPNENYVVTREDNESILLSQFYGDGSVERRSSFKIEHGYKQKEYLKFKVSLLNKAYPETNGLEAINKRIYKDYTSYTYRTGQVLIKQINKILESTVEQNINRLTPFGICLLYLDDGYLSINTEYNTVELGISSVNEDLLNSLKQYFITYGYNFTITSKALVIRSKVEIIKFIKDFIEPYKHLLPECMHYKLDYKDIVGSIH